MAFVDAPHAKASEVERFVVVELFTSQGCASCPPADAYLSEIVQRKGVLVPSQHIDHWNYMGWKDPFSSATASKRQKAHANSLGARYVYTPQMVDGGRTQDAGMNREAIEAMLADARRAIDKKLALRVYPGTINEVKLALPATPAKGSKEPDHTAHSATIWLVASAARTSARSSAARIAVRP